MKALLKKYIIPISFAILSFLSPIIQGVIIEKVKDFNYFETAKNMLNGLLQFVIKLLIFKIPLWVVILLFFGISILAIFLIYKYSNNSENLSEDSGQNEWQKYKTEKYNGLLYTWEYVNNYGKVEIINIKPICECGCDLVLKDSYRNMHKYNGFLVCPNCGRGYENNFDENINDVENLVVFKTKEVLKKYSKKIEEYNNVNTENLTCKEKEVLKLFYNKNLKKYINKKVALNVSKYSDEIESLTERKILKELSDIEKIEKYTSDGIQYELTEEAFKKLNI